MYRHNRYKEQVQQPEQTHRNKEVVRGHIPRATKQLESHLHLSPLGDFRGKIAGKLSYGWRVVEEEGKNGFALVKEGADLAFH